MTMELALACVITSILVYPQVERYNNIFIQTLITHEQGCERRLMVTAKDALFKRIIAIYAQVFL